jgi:glutamate racemase
MLIAQYCSPLLAEGADTIVLGCTHYPFVRHLIEQVVGSNVALIDTGAAVAKQLKRQLQEKGLLSSILQQAQVHFWTNSENENSAQVIEALWGRTAHVDHL